MKSKLLASKLADIFGGDDDAGLRQLLAGAANDHPALVDGLTRFLDVTDNLTSQLVNLQKRQSELSGDAFSNWNLRSGKIDSGRQWKALLGYADGDTADTIVAWRQAVHSDDLKRLDAAIAAHVRGQSSGFEAACRMRHKSGAWCWIYLKGVVVERDERREASRILLLQRDITAFKIAEDEALLAKEAAETANQSRSFFMANMSHELRTPMNGIIGMTELALDTELDAEQKHYLRTVKSSAESLLAILNDILDFSKIEAGKLRFEKIPFSLSSLVFEAVRAQSVPAHQKGLEVIVALDDDLPVRVIGDPTRLRQVLSNLVGNAVKFTERGEITVEVALGEHTAVSALLRFAVRDTGIGIPPARQSAIFEAFSQADDSTTRRFGGTGLGLTICKHLVQMMGGDIRVDSVEGEGSCFFFSARFATDALAALPVTQQFTKRRALLVTDHPAVAAQLLVFLEKAGVHATHISQPAAAIEAVEKSRALGFPYDFVLAEAGMPAPAGVALAERHQQVAAASDERPERLIMLLNTEQQRQYLKRLRELGVDAYLVKPLSFDDLVEALKLVIAPAAQDEWLSDVFDLSDPATNRGAERDALLVEDNPVNQELAERLLSKRGFRVTRANNGAEAIECFENKRFDFIFMDMQMPVMGGIEATEAIRSREMRRSWVVSGDFRPVYIGAMTANAMEGDRERCLQAGMNDYVAKPIKSTELDAAIDRGLGLEENSLSQAAGAEASLTATTLDLGTALRDLGDRDLLQTMASMLLGEWDEHLARIAGDLAARDAPKLCLDAHTLKSLLAIFHCERARRLALDIERAARSEEGADWQRCTQLADSLRLEMARLKPEMERFVRGEITL